MDIMQFQSILSKTLSDLKTRYPSFDESCSTYTAQYGNSSIKVYEPYKISGTIDPVTIILGRTTSLFYKDSRHVLSGRLASVTLEKDQVYLLGRRKTRDSKLLVWSTSEEIEIEHYDSRVRIIPSRIHAAIFSMGPEEVYFSDLGSSSGSLLVGESSKPGPFIALYGFHIPSTTSMDVHRITMEHKYTRQ
jgi:hypothetical protein